MVVGRPSVERPSSVSRHVIRDGGREVRGSRWSVERGIRPRSAVEAGEAASTVVVQASVGDGMTDSEGNTRQTRAEIGDNWEEDGDDCVEV